MRQGFVGVHVGAGDHLDRETPVYMGICSGACKVAIDVLNTGGSALEAAYAATVVLEDAPETNAGLGSNLTENGTVEMEAGMMDGSSLLFGAVGAISGVKNPIRVAKLLVQEQMGGTLPLDRVPPGFLVGEGARDWAIRHSVPPATETLITDKTWSIYQHCKRQLNNFQMQARIHQKRKYSYGDLRTKAARHCLDNNVNDTVGAVVIDSMGNTASTVSSGGAVMRRSGRVGSAAAFGCGCWAQSSHGQGFPVAVSTTGCGEQIGRSFLARECALELKGSSEPVKSLNKVMKEKFVDSPFLAGDPDKVGGAICLRYDEEGGQGRFLWSHTTPSMGVGCQTTAEEKAYTKMSKMPIHCQTGGPTPTTSIFVDSVSFATNVEEETIFTLLDI